MLPGFCVGLVRLWESLFHLASGYNQAMRILLTDC